MMTLDHRKADILAQLTQANVATLITNLATFTDALEFAQAKIKELEQQVAELSPKTEAPAATV